MNRAGRSWLRTLVVCVAAAPSAAGRAQAGELAGVRLEWHGPPTCAQPGDVLQRARRSADPAWRDDDSATVAVDLRAVGEGGNLELTFEAQSSVGAARRVLNVESCEEARRTAALLIALVLEAGARDAAAVAPARVGETSQAEPAPEARAASALAPPAPAAPTAPASPVEPPAPRAPPRDDERPPPMVASPREQDASPVEADDRRFRDGPTLGVAGGLETAVIASAHGVFTVWAGWRFGAFELDVGGSVWLPARGTLDTVSVEVEQLGALVGSCYWFSLARWELGPSVRLLVERVEAELNSFDAGAKPWVRAAAGLRAGVWISERLSLQLVADVPFSLGRPTFTTTDGASAQPPPIGFNAQAGLAWAP